LKRAGRAPTSRQGRAPAGAARLRQTRTAHDLDSVARLAGVSAATVSRVINQPQIVAPQTVARVRAAIARVGYVPNRIAGGLASRRTGLIALIVPGIVHSVFNDTIEAMTGRLAAAGFQVMLGLSGYGPGDIDPMLQRILSRRPEGIILTGFAGQPAVRRRLRNTGITVIETWELPDRPLDVAIGFSHAQIGSEMADFAAERGYRHVGIIASDSLRARTRRDAFCHRYASLGLPEPQCVDVLLPSTVAHGRAAFNALLARAPRPELVVCSSDWLALGVTIEARRHGLAQPGELGVLGFGNFDFAAALDPDLTTVHVDGDAIGRECAQLLLTRARGEKPGQRFIDIGARIVARGSTRAKV
jgi:LacI family gluconate utilization system Gnt-I transcriptional repressor